MQSFTVVSGEYWGGFVKKKKPGWGRGGSVFHIQTQHTSSDGHLADRKKRVFILEQCGI